MTPSTLTYFGEINICNDITHTMRKQSEVLYQLNCSFLAHLLYISLSGSYLKKENVKYDSLSFGCG